MAKDRPKSQKVNNFYEWNAPSSVGLKESDIQIKASANTRETILNLSSSFSRWLPVLRILKLNSSFFSSSSDTQGTSCWLWCRKSCLLNRSIDHCTAFCCLSLSSESDYFLKGLFAIMAKRAKVSLISLKTFRSWWSNFLEATKWLCVTMADRMLTPCGNYRG